MYRSVDFVNSYSMKAARHRCDRLEDYPAHHLWGLNGIAALGKSVIFHDGPDELDRLRWLGRLGLNKYVRYQLWLWWTQARRSNLFAGAWSVAWLLGLFRRIGLLRTPLIVLIHHPVRNHALFRQALKGFDAIVFLNRHAMDATTRIVPEVADRSHLLGWFVDAGFYRPYRRLRQQPPTETVAAEAAAAAARPLRIVSAGKELRDFDTLIEAAGTFARDEVEVEVYCSAETAPSASAANAKVVRGASHDNPISYTALLERYGDADVIAIPMREATRTAGLTSIMDAFGIGRPMIVTRNVGVDYDLESLGVGFTVGVGDVAAWRRHIESLRRDPDRLARMSAAAAALADERLAEGEYAARLDAIFARYFR